MQELKEIKKYFGEDMMHFCRDNFATILEKENALWQIIDSKFEHSKLLYEDLVKYNLLDGFKDYIYGIYNKGEDYLMPKTDKSPEELLDSANYDLYECHTEEEIQEFKKYYAPGEELCTFRGGRLNSSHVFFAVRRDASYLNRVDFFSPKRQDLYGTSVISIQFTRGDVNTLSIKNRYNHTVENPDATFGNNLERIATGLTYSFQEKYKLRINSNATNFGLTKHNYCVTKDGKFIRYNFEYNNIYYCDNNIIFRNGKIDETYKDKSKYLLIDYFIVDLVNKKIELYDPYVTDSFLNGLDNISKIDIIKADDNKILKITTNNNEIIKIKIDKTNSIIGYYNPYLKNIKCNFLFTNNSLKEINIPNVETIDEGFLPLNICLEELSLPKVMMLKDSFLSANKCLKKLYIPMVQEIGDLCLTHNQNLQELSLPETYYIGNNFLTNNNCLKHFDAPKLEEVGEFFLYQNNSLTDLSLPCLLMTSHYFLGRNNSLINVSLPNLEYASDFVFEHNQTIKNISAPNLKKVGAYFLNKNPNKKSFSFPKLVNYVAFNEEEIEEMFDNFCKIFK